MNLQAAKCSAAPLYLYPALAILVKLRYNKEHGLAGLRPAAVRILISGFGAVGSVPALGETARAVPQLHIGVLRSW